MGNISTPCCVAKRIINAPAETSGSLFANKILFFALIASMVGISPILPCTALSVASAWGIAAASINPSMPHITLMFVSASEDFNSEYRSFLYITANKGLYFLHCSASKAALSFAESETIRTSLKCSMTSSDCLPMEPVEPSSETVLILIASHASE
jgi:hypothetical protein